MCTLEKRGNIFILTLTGTDDHRLNPNLISSIRSHLATARSQASPGSVLITTAEGKFFSNGFDLAWAKQTSGGSSVESVNLLRHMVGLFKGVVSDFIDFPMPTIAAVTGHAAAAGMMLVMSHDYVIMLSKKSVFYMSEVDIGMTLPDYFATLVRSKVARPEVRRDMLLCGAKIRGDEALGKGLVEQVYQTVQEVVDGSVRLADEFAKRKWDGEVYCEIRKSLYPELVELFGLSTKELVKARL